MKKRFVFVLIIISCINVFPQWELRVEGLPKWLVANPIDIGEDSTIAMFVRTGEFPRLINISTNLGQSWTNYNTSEKWDGNDVSIIDKSNIWFCSSSKIYYSNNGGLDWVLQYSDASDTRFFNFINFFDKDTGIVVGDAIDINEPAIILRTTNGGNDWESVNDNYLIGELSSDVYYPIEFPSPSIGYFFVARDKKLNKTYDGGRTWEILQLPEGISNAYMLKFYDDNLGILVSKIYPGDDFLYRTTDGGKSWTKLSVLTNTSHHDIEFVPNSPEKIWFTDYINLFFSPDTGNTWTEVKITDTLKARNIEFLNDNIGFILGDDGIFYATENNGGITSIHEVKKQKLSNRYILHQNYPNPFNPATSIKYFVPNQTKVNLTVYDVLGKQVNVLVSDYVSAGEHVIVFDGDNLSSGIYYYILRIDNNQIVKNMVLIK